MRTNLLLGLIALIGLLVSLGCNNGGGGGATTNPAPSAPVKPKAQSRGTGATMPEDDSLKPGEKPAALPGAGSKAGK